MSGAMSKSTRAAALSLLLALFWGIDRGAQAQTPHQLVSILTNETSLGLPNEYGLPASAAANDAGDFTFVGLRGTALFYRKAGTAAPIRAVQAGDQIPGLAGSRLAQITSSVALSANGLAVVVADVYTTSRVTSAVLTFDGTTLRTLVTGLDTAPGTGGAHYERTITLVDVNAGGDVLIGATLVPTGSAVAPSPTVFLLPAGGGSVRVAGPGTASPGTGGTFTNATGSGINASGQVLLNAAITGGSGASGLFVWESGTLRKVAATGDASPAGGTFTDFFTGVSQRLNNSGVVAFTANNSLFTNTAGGGTVLAVAAGSAAPAPMGGTFTTMTGISAFSNSGDVVFSALVSGGASGSGLFRYRSGTGVEVVARMGEPAPGSGQGITNFFGVSVNASGTVSFQSTLSGGSNGLYQKPAGGALIALASMGDPSPVGGVMFFQGFPTYTLPGGGVVTRAQILNAASAHHGAFTFAGAVTPLMTTADQMPPGASEVIRPTNLTAGGGYLGFEGQKSGGREVIGFYNPSTHVFGVVTADGATVATAGNSHLQFQGVNSVQVSAGGDIVAQVSLFGGPVLAVRNAILAGGHTTPLAPVMYDGQVDNGGRTLTLPSLASQGVRPIAINASGTVAFTAVSNDTFRGLWVGSAGATPTKVALPGDVTSTGDVLTGVFQFHGGINNAGQILLVANTASGRALFVVTPGSAPIKVAQVGDAAPGGGTFLALGTIPMPSLNNSGQVAFIATTAGGPGGGVYLATPSGGGYAVEAIALNGAASPAGGLYVLNAARPEVVLNDSGHIAFLSDLTGGASNSGIFVRRGPLAAVEAVVLQGQPAPGTGSTFTTFAHAANSFIEETHAISASGQIAFRGTVSIGGVQTIGWWHADTTNVIQPIVVVPSSPAAFDGGTAAATALVANWLSGDRFPVWAPLANGPNDGGLYAYVPTGGASTGAGTNVLVTPTDNLTGVSANVTFSNVTSPGVTSLTRASTGPVLPRGWYRAAPFGAYYTLTTTATFTGTVNVCLDFSDQNPPAGAVMQLLHWENNAWQNVTTTVNGSIVCGTTTSLDLFVPAHALNEPTANIVQNGTFGSGSNSWQVFATDGTVQDNSYIQFSVNNGVFEYYRVPPPSGSNQAVVLQNTGVGFAAGAPIVAHFTVGNTSSVRKRISVLIHASDFSDLSVCTFWIPPNTPMRAYAMRTHTTVAWSGASMSFYAASAGSNGGVYQLDNVVMGPGHALTLGRTDCVDPGEPGPTVVTTADNPSVVNNGSFSTNSLSGWTAFGTITAQVSGGVAQFIRPTNDQPSGVLLQPTNTAVGAGQVVTASFRLGNSSGVRKRITILMHDFSFGDLSACTFWLPANTQLATYAMRTYTTQAWSNATIAFYPATTDAAQWFLVDDVSLKVTPSVRTYGSDCVEPIDVSDLSSAPAPAPEPLLQPIALVVSQKPVFTPLHSVYAELKSDLLATILKSAPQMKSTILASRISWSNTCRIDCPTFERGLLAPF
jgi:hypothetical protein